VAFCLSGNGFVHINKVTLRRAQLVLGWVTVREFKSRLYCLGIHSDQLSLAIPSWVGAMNASAGHSHCWGKNCEFCVTVATLPGLLIYWHSRLKALADNWAADNWAGHPANMWLYAKLIRCNRRQLKVLLKGMSSHVMDLKVYVRILSYICFYFCKRLRLTYVLNSDLTWLFSSYIWLYFIVFRWCLSTLWILFIKDRDGGSFGCSDQWSLSSVIKSSSLSSSSSTNFITTQVLNKTSGPLLLLLLWLLSILCVAGNGGWCSRVDISPGLSSRWS